MKRLAVIISPNYKDYASKYLAECMASLRVQAFTDFDVFAIDNETSPESQALIKRLAPEARLIALEGNEGFAGGNNAALREVIKEGYEFAFVLNMDTVSEVQCLGKLMAAAEKYPDAGAIQARLMLHPNIDLVNSLGNVTHFLGFGYSLSYQSAFADTDSRTAEIAYPSGAAVLFRVEALKKVGLFDEEMWMYNEDQDLGWRLWLAGWRCIIAPEAVVHHKYEFSRSIKKYYWMDRNRIITILKNFHILTLVLIAPAFIVMELGLTLFSFQSGWWPEKKKVWHYFLKKKNWSHILHERHRIQLGRVIKEKKIASLITGRIWYQEIDDLKLRLINPVFDLYWKIVRGLMWW